MNSGRLTIVLLILVCAGYLAARRFDRPDGARQRSVLRMVSSEPHPPYAYMRDGRLIGLDVELGELIAREAGLPLEIATAPFSELVGMVRDGRADMAICALAVTDDRRRLVDFSDPYAFDGMIIMVRSDANIRHLADIEGRAGFRVGAEKGSTGHQMMDKRLAGTRRGILLYAYPEIKEAVIALMNGEVDAVILDLLVATSLQLEYPGRLTILSDMLNHDPLAVAVSRNDPELLGAANRVIHRLWESGVLFTMKKKHADRAFGEDADDAGQ